MNTDNNFTWIGLKVSLIAVLSAHAGYFIVASELPLFLRRIGFGVIVISIGCGFWGGLMHFREMFGRKQPSQEETKFIKCTSCQKEILAEDVRGDICPNCSEAIEDVTC